MPTLCKGCVAGEITVSSVLSEACCFSLTYLPWYNVLKADRCHLFMPSMHQDGQKLQSDLSLNAKPKHNPSYEVKAQKLCYAHGSCSVRGDHFNACRVNKWGQGV